MAENRRTRSNVGLFRLSRRRLDALTYEHRARIRDIRGAVTLAGP